MSCSNIPDGAGTAAEEQLLMPRKKRAATGMCVKCKSEKGRILRLSIAYCKPCFHLQYYARLAKTLHPPLYPVPTVVTTTTVPPNGQTPVKQLVGRPPRQAGDMVIGLSGGAGSMSLLDIMVAKGYIGTRESSDGQETANGTFVLERGKKEATWRKIWAVHVDFSNVIPEVEDQSSMIDQHLNERYPDYNIELVVIRAEEAYSTDLPQRLQAYDLASTPESTSSAHHGVMIDLTKPELPIIKSSSASQSPLESLTALLQTLPSASHPHLLNNILTSLLQLACSYLPNIGQLLLGETSTRQAQNIIAGAAIGNGWGLPIDLQGVYVFPKFGASVLPQHNIGDDSLPVTRASTPVPAADHITRIKPLRESMIKEAAYYCHIKRIPTVNHRMWDRTIGSMTGQTRIKGVGEARGKGGINSLEKLTEGVLRKSWSSALKTIDGSSFLNIDFITNLGATHPSTVSTISRTGSKLVFKRQPGSVTGDSTGQAGLTRENVVCPLCGLPAEPSSLDWKARTALTSLGKIPAIAPTGNTIEAPANRKANHAHDLAPLLCYACLTAMSPSSTGVIGGAVSQNTPSNAGEHGVGLPFWVSDRVSARLGLNRVGDIQEDHLHPDESRVGGRELSMQEMKAAVDEFLIQDDEDDE
ncbi:hypothetical protein QFC22_000128 [Naganishia vaughanmartiniae]|uniref:Uncharacterized protein n=1 Tax=Naganishia vaughanmartiniae TaxID=1424756 RepID=A0ACC2XP83_9TREE|nr:hypothetical protein QFC22_000128 [Naganishia vaughanmartiniae]